MNTATLDLPFSAAAARRRAFRAVLRRTARSIWRGLEAIGQRRAERQMAFFVQMHGDQYPELAERFGRKAPADRRPAA